MVVALQARHNNSNPPKHTHTTPTSVSVSHSASPLPHSQPRSAAPAPPAGKLRHLFPNLHPSPTHPPHPWHPPPPRSQPPTHPPTLPLAPTSASFSARICCAGPTSWKAVCSAITASWSAPTCASGGGWWKLLSGCRRHLTLRHSGGSGHEGLLQVLLCRCMPSEAQAGTVCGGERDARALYCLPTASTRCTGL